MQTVGVSSLYMNGLTQKKGEYGPARSRRGGGGGGGAQQRSHEVCGLEASLRDHPVVALPGGEDGRRLLSLAQLREPKRGRYRLSR